MSSTFPLACNLDNALAMSLARAMPPDHAVCHKIVYEELEKSLLQLTCLWGGSFGLCIVKKHLFDATITCRGVSKQLSLNLWVCSPVVHTACEICAVSHKSCTACKICAENRTAHSVCLLKQGHVIFLVCFYVCISKPY